MLILYTSTQWHFQCNIFFNMPDTTYSMPMLDHINRLHICLQQVSSPQSSTMPSGTRERRLQIVGQGPSHIFVAEEYPIYVPMVGSWYFIAAINNLYQDHTVTFKYKYMTVARNISNYMY